MRKKLTIKEHRYAQHSAYEKIAKIRDKIILIDTHLSVKTPKGYFPGISDDLAKLVGLDSIVLFEFNPKDVIKRRKKDAKLKKIEAAEVGTIRIPRQREIETEAQIKEHQEFNRNYAFIVANVADATVKILDLRFKEKRSFDQAKKAAEEIIKLIKA
jgi:adenylate kinase